MARTTVMDVRKVNRSLILKEFYFNGPVTRLDVSRVTKLSPATVTNIVTDLLENGILIEEGSLESAGGRPSILLRVNPEIGFFIGVELGEMDIRTHLYDAYFLEISRNRIADLPLDITPQQLVSNIFSSVTHVLNTAGIKEEEVLGIGIGVPGIADPVDGVSVFSPNWGWNKINLVDMLHSITSIPIYIDNGVKALSVAELLFGQGKGVEEFAVLMVDTGVGGAIIHNDMLQRGGSNSAGEIGHMTLALDGPECRCGSRGCLEAFVGLNRLYAQFESRLPGENHSRTYEQLLEYFANYQMENRPEREIIQTAIHYLGAGIANLINIENPQRIILGGRLGVLYSQANMNLILATVKKYALAQSFDFAEICVSTLGEDGIPKGAAAMALIDFFENVNQEALVMLGGNRLKRKM
jgi:predicted NBD/HSP70 family sugar kinase